MRASHFCAAKIALCGFLLTLVSVPSLHAQTATSAKPTTGADHLSVGGNVPKPFTVSLDELRKLPHQTIQVMNAHENRQETYEGVPLVDLLRQAGAPQGEQIRGALMTTYVIAEGSDGYRVIFSLAELDPGFQDSGVLVADRMDGALITGDLGPLRLVVPTTSAPRAGFACSTQSPCPTYRSDRLGVPH